MDYIIIPARMESKRLPGKPLLKETGKYLVQHTWEQCKKSKLAHDVIIAVDDLEVQKICHSFGAKAIMTSKFCRNGSERCAEVCQWLIEPKYIINVQCEYPTISPRMLDQLFADQSIEGPVQTVTTLSYKTINKADYFSNSNVKVVVDNSQHALYFSRSPIPYQEPFKRANIHVGVYGYEVSFIEELYSCLTQSSIYTRMENLEQLDWLALGIPIKVQGIRGAITGIDTQEEYARFVHRYTLPLQSG